MSEIRMLLDEIRELKRRLQALETRQEHPGFAASDVARLSQNNTFAGVQTIPNTGLHLLDTNASHDLIVKPGSDLSADRTLTVTTGDANRTVTLTGNVTANQDVSTAGSPAFAGLTTPAIATASGALTVTPAAGSGVAFVLSTTGDFVINTSHLCVDTSVGFTGFGVAAPTSRVHIYSAASTDPNILFRLENAYRDVGFKQGTSGNVQIIQTYAVASGTDTGILALQPNAGNVGISTTAPAGRVHINGTADDQQLIVEAHSTQTANLVEWQDSAGAVLSGVRGNGGWIPASLTDANAANNTVYYSTTASKLVYKDAGGTVNNLY